METQRETATEAGVAYIVKQNDIFFRQGWIYRWVGWVCGWGATALALFSATWVEKHQAGDDQIAVWCSVGAGLLTAVVQTVKPERWADAYYRGHLILEAAIGDHALGKGSVDELDDAWRRAQGALPGASGGSAGA